MEPKDPTRRRQNLGYAVGIAVGLVCLAVFLWPSQEQLHALGPSSVYPSNLAVGLLNHEVVNIRHKWFLTGWMLVHVSLAVVLLILLNHAFIAFYYQ